MNKKRFFIDFLGLMLIMLLFLSACKPAAATPSVPPTKEATATSIPPSPISPTEPPSPTPVPPTEVPSPTPMPSPTETPGLPPLPPDAQAIEFQSEDGQTLEGTYYPAAINPAPMVVLMHWAGGDQYDWVEIAYWLQNRGLGGDTPNPENIPWLDSSWFPPMLEGQSFAVFAFTFRGCEGGCSSFKPAQWLLDARAAISKAAGLEGVDATKVVAIGASIGADGAPDGCSLVNKQNENACQGALSLSPGNYLTLSYPEVIKALDDAGKPVWCFYADEDKTSAAACKAASGKQYRVVEYAGRDHGMTLIRPGLEHETLLLILDFLKLVFGL